jgi:hypothetical protein
MPVHNVVFAEAYAYPSARDIGLEFVPPNMGGADYGKNAGWQVGGQGQMMEPNMMGGNRY